MKIRNVLKDFSYEVQTKSYSSQVKHIGEDFIVMNRIHNNKKTVNPIDVYGPVWIVGLSSTNNKISIKNGSEFIDLVEPCGFLAPPFSVLKWRVMPGVFKWTAVVSNKVLPDTFNNKPFIFDWNEVMPTNLKELLSLVSNAKLKTNIEMQTLKSPVAGRVKAFIDASYKDNVSVGEIAETLKLSSAYVCREFKKAYELSPIEYRHRVRLFDAIKSLSMGISVTEACLNSGFSSINQFNLHFKRYLGTIPLDYSVEKNPTKKLIIKS